MRTGMRIAPSTARDSLARCPSNAVHTLTNVLFFNLKIPGYSLKKAISLRAAGKESIPNQRL